MHHMSMYSEQIPKKHKQTYMPENQPENLTKFKNWSVTRYDETKRRTVIMCLERNKHPDLFVYISFKNLTATNRTS